MGVKLELKAARHNAPTRGTAQGFTLLEMIITLSIAALLLTLAVPSFQAQIRNARLSTASKDLMAALIFTRSETIGRSDFVSICQSDPNSVGCASSGGWEQGWLVFVDSDADGALDNASDILHTHEALDPGITARWASAAGQGITFRPNGLTSLAATRTIVLCDERGFDPDGIAIVVSMLGKASSMPATGTAETDCTP
jgi:type IV fimbrial biogenesis protein FimT